jgi:predicted nuclease of predicted toxin-antitoxin system
MPPWHSHSWLCPAAPTGKSACDNDCVIISKDEDFFYAAYRPEARAKLVWVRLGNCRTSVLLEEFDRLWWRIEAALNAGEHVVEIR